jgi:hypothetical protein
VSIEAHRRLTLADLESRKRSRMPNNRHPLRQRTITSLIPRIPLNRRRKRLDLRVQRHTTQRQLRPLPKRHSRMNIPKPAYPEQGRAKRYTHLPRPSFLHSVFSFQFQFEGNDGARTVTVLQSAAAMPNASRCPAAWSSACIGNAR